MSATPNFASTPRAAVVQISTANTARDGTGTVGTLMTGVAAGTLVWRVYATATGTTTAGVLRLFRSTDGGTTKRLVQEIIVAALTPSTSSPAYTGQFPVATLSRPIQLASTSDILYVSTNNAETFNVFAEGGDLT